MAKNVLQRFWDKEKQEWVEMHPITKASNVYMQDGKTVQEKVDVHLADYVKHPVYAVATGSANAYTVTLNPAPTAYVDGMAVSIKIPVDSTGPSTLNVNGLGAKPLKKANGNDVTNLKANGVYTFRYNASTGNFILQGEGGSGNAQPSDVLSGKTFTNDFGEQVGTMPNRGAYNITPRTSNVTIPAGYHNGSGVVYGDPDLIPSNIRQGVSIFGVTGTLIEGKRWARGDVVSSAESFSFEYLASRSTTSQPVITVTGLSFTPSLIIIIRRVTGINGNLTVYTAGKMLDNYESGQIAIVPLEGTYNSATTRSFKAKGNAYVNSNGFRLPVSSSNDLYTWMAYE